MEFLSRFHFTWEYRKGVLNAADPLSRIRTPTTGPHVRALSVSLLPGDLKSQLLEAYRADPTFADPLHTEEWTQDAVSGLWLTKQLQVVVPTSMRSLIIAEHHNTALSGHQGCERTTKAIRKSFWWQGLDADVDAHIAQCPQCQRNKSPTTRPTGLAQSLPVPERVYTRPYMEQHLHGLHHWSAPHRARPRRYSGCR